MIDRQARLGQAMQLLAAKKIEQLSRALDADPGALSPPEAVAMIRAGSQLEREARGANADPEDPSERVSAFERAVIEAIEQADVVTAQRVRHAIYLLGAHTGSPSVR